MPSASTLALHSDGWWQVFPWSFFPLGPGFLPFSHRPDQSPVLPQPAPQQRAPPSSPHLEGLFSLSPSTTARSRDTSSREIFMATVFQGLFLSQERAGAG